MAKITIKIDEQKADATEGERLLDVCTRQGIWMPTLCDHPDLKPYGVCRLCIVEQDRGGWSKVVTSCNFPVKDGQVFYTNSERIVRERGTIMEFILARSSKTPEVIALARRLGIESAKFPAKDEGCILCGMCVRVCSEVVGAGAISFAGRGPARKVAAPFYSEAGDCIGCGSCAYICPTRYIELKEDENTRGIPLWNVTFEMTHCKRCGQKVAPKKQIEFFRKRTKGIPEDWFDYCQSCRGMK